MAYTSPSRAVAGCDFHLELAARAWHWEEPVLGAVVMACGPVKQKILSVSLALWSDAHPLRERPRGLDREVRLVETFELDAGEVLRLPFSLELPAGLDLEFTGTAAAFLTTSSYDEGAAALLFRVLPYRQFTEAAGCLARLSGLPIAEWRSNGPRAEAILRPGPRLGAPRVIRLTLERASDGCWAQVESRPLGWRWVAGAFRRNPGSQPRVWLPADDPAEWEERLRDAYQASLGGNAALPIPAGPAASAPTDLPLPSGQPATETG